VAQAPSQLQQFTHWLESASLQIADSREFRQLNRRIRRSFRKNLFLKKLFFKPQIAHLWGTTIALALLIWNWQLVLALVIGAGVLVSVYLAQQGQWQIPKIQWQQWTGANRSLTLAIATGTIATLSTYITTHIWLEADQSWLAIGIILQGCGTLSILLFLTWQTLNRQTEKPEQVKHDRLDDFSTSDRTQILLAQLTDPDPLKRLLAVRQVTHLFKTDVPLPLTAPHLTDCFRLMLNRETDATVCSALLESLQAIGQRQLSPSSQPLVSLKKHQIQVEPSES
jgi:hypothetical protein